MDPTKKPPTSLAGLVGEIIEASTKAKSSKHGEAAQAKPDEAKPFRRVDPYSWLDPRVQGLSDRASRLLSYLQTGPESSSEGLFVLAVSTMAAAFRWDVRKARRALEELERVDLVRFDETTYTVLVMDKLAVEMPRSRYAIASARVRIQRLHYTVLFEVFEERIVRFSEASGAPHFALEFRDAMIEVLERKRGQRNGRSERAL